MSVERERERQDGDDFMLEELFEKGLVSKSRQFANIFSMPMP